MLAASQVVLYICFALLMGYFVLNSVPQSARPTIQVQKKLIVALAIIIPITSLVPVIDVIWHLVSRLGLIDATVLVFSSTTVGLTWLLTLVFSIMLIVLVSRGTYPRFGMLLMVIFIALNAWASHAASMNFTTGMISDLLHVLPMSIWVGTLMIIALFAKDHANWGKFLNWFSIVAAVCLLMITISGLLLMGVLVPSYVTSWVTNYGQGLFTKHLFLVPIVLLAFVNGIVGRLIVKRNDRYNPLPFVRAEAGFLMFILIITAIFTQTLPPIHNLTDDMISPIFSWLHGSAMITGDTRMDFAFSGIAVAFLAAAAISMCVFAMSLLIRQIPTYVTFLIGLLFVVSTYLFVMKSIVLV